MKACNKSSPVKITCIGILAAVAAKTACSFLKAAFPKHRLNSAKNHCDLQGPALLSLVIYEQKFHDKHSTHIPSREGCSCRLPAAVGATNGCVCIDFTAILLNCNLSVWDHMGLASPMQRNLSVGI